MPPRAARLIRGAAAGALATFVAAFFHMLGGGEAPSPLGLSITLFAAMWVSILLVGRSFSVWRLVVPVALSQVLFHMLFSFTVVPGSFASSGHAAHAHDSVTAALASQAEGASVSLHIFTSGPVMWVSHAIAIAVTIAMLRHGERMLRHLATLAERAVAWLRACVDLVPAAGTMQTRLPLAPSERAPRAPRRPELAPLLRRGPPLAFS